MQTAYERYQEKIINILPGSASFVSPIRMEYDLPEGRFGEVMVQTQIPIQQRSVSSGTFQSYNPPLLKKAIYVDPRRTLRLPRGGAVLRVVSVVGKERAAVNGGYKDLSEEELDDPERLYGETDEDFKTRIAKALKDKADKDVRDAAAAAAAAAGKKP